MAPRLWPLWEGEGRKERRAYSRASERAVRGGRFRTKRPRQVIHIHSDVGDSREERSESEELRGECAKLQQVRFSTNSPTSNATFLLASVKGFL